MKNLSEERERRLLPFFVEFVKFSAAFSLLLAVALVTLHAATLAQ